MQALIFSWGLAYISPTGCPQQFCEKVHKYIISCCTLLFAKIGAIFTDSKVVDTQIYSSMQTSTPLLWRKRQSQGMVLEQRKNQQPYWNWYHLYSDKKLNSCLWLRHTGCLILPSTVWETNL